MADDLKKRAPQDDSKINVYEPWELKYWTEKFGVTKAVPTTAVDAVGTSAKTVEDYLRRNSYG